MKTILIGDIHGRDTWKKVIERESPNRVIFIGDYFDSFDIPGIDQIHNFKEIIHFKENTDIEVIMLIGNHDHHYLDVGETYSGFQHILQHDIKWVLKENMKHLQLCYSFDNILSSHAGISSVWLDNTLGSSWDEETLVETLNDLYQYQPTKFNFQGSDPYGDSIQSSPIWIRPKSLTRSNRKTDLKKNWIQIVGHTEFEKIDMKMSLQAYGNKYFFIDALEHGWYMKWENNILTPKTNNKGVW